MESFVLKAFKSPIRLLVLVTVLYMASHSEIVMALLFIFAAVKLFRVFTRAAKTPASPDVVVPKPSAEVHARKPAAESQPPAQPAYAKSAVVTPFPSTRAARRR